MLLKYKMYMIMDMDMDIVSSLYQNLLLLFGHLFSLLPHFL